MQSPIFESFYQDRSRSGTTDICMNLYPEHRDGPKGPEIGLLISLPGKELVTTVGSGPIRCMYPARNGLMYVVSGNELYSVDTGFNKFLIGTTGTSSGPVSMVDGVHQILFVDGQAGWLWDFLSNQYIQVIPNSNTDDTGPNSVIYQDGFAIVNSIGTNQIYQSNYNDLSQFATLVGGGLGATANNAFVQGNPRDVITMFDLKREVWIFKSNATEIWINQGSPGFSFAQLQGVYIPVGCAAAASVAKMGDSLCWLGSDNQGDGVIYQSVGYQVKPITTPSISAMLQSKDFVLHDAIAYGQNIAGHHFYVITFPTQNMTFAYDLVTQKWHQRGHYNNGVMERQVANCYANFAGGYYVGDYRNGNIYLLNEDVYTDNGDPKKWVRSWSALPSSLSQGIPMSFDSIQVIMETGATVPQGVNPQILLEWSDDGGYVWQGPFQVPCGKVGETSWRAIQNRLGSTTLRGGLYRVFRISGTDPIGIKITGAEFEGGPS